MFKQTQSAKKEIICHCCGEKGHYANKCPKKGDIAPNKWAIKTGSIKTGSTNLQQDQKNTSDNQGWAWNTFQHLVNQPETRNEQFQGVQGNNEGTYDFLIDTIIIDSGSTIKATFMNPRFLTNIRKSENPIIMQTNAGVRKIELEGDLEGFGVVKFDPEQ